MHSAHAVNWFEIPVQDLDRAAQFYERALATRLTRMVFGGTPMAVFGANDPGVSGALLYDPQRKPSTDGALVYLGTLDLEGALVRAQEAGGQVLVDKTDLGDMGLFAILRDSEGNVVGLHQGWT
jgi:uncharacterized protein